MGVTSHRDLAEGATGHALHHHQVPAPGNRLPRSARRRGQGRTGGGPRSDHAGWTPPSDRRDPVEILEQQSETRLPELVPIRYGRMLVSPFTFFRGAAGIMAMDLAGTPDSGLPRPGLWRRAPLQLRRLRCSRPASRLRPQRLRRDAAGALGVGPQAPDRELRDRRAGARLQEAEPRGGADDGRRVSPSDARVRGDANLDVWYARLDVETLFRDLQVADKQIRRSTRTSTRPRRTRCGPWNASTEVDGEPEIAAIRRCWCRPRPRLRRSRRARGADPRAAGPLPGDAQGGPPPSLRQLSVRRHGAQGRRGRQRRDPRLGGSGRPRRRSALSAGQGGRGLGARALRRRERLREPRRAGG